MSRSRDGAPSNSELAERTARIEEQVDHVADTVDRIETTISDDLEETEEQVEANAERVASMWTAYRLARWGIPVAGTLVGALAGLASAGII